jgi:hypothetical protein
MITALVTAAFFIVMAAVLQFSSWAEGWLSSRAVPIAEPSPDATRTGALPVASPAMLEVS